MAFTVALGIAATASTAHAAPGSLECAWLSLPPVYRQGSPTQHMPGEVIVRVMRTCGVPVTGAAAQTLGTYFDARHHMTSSAAALGPKYGFTPSRLAALVAKVTAADRAALVAMLKTSVTPVDTQAHIRQIVADSGIPASDIAAQTQLGQYIVGAILAAELGR